MAYENRKYVIINASEVGSVGDTPSFLDGKTQYNHSQIRTILDGTDWTEEIE